VSFAKLIRLSKVIILGYSMWFKSKRILSINHDVHEKGEVSVVLIGQRHPCGFNYFI
jgi:hypothetical protein